MGTFQDPQTGDWYMGPDHSAGLPDNDLLSRGIVKDPLSEDYFQVPQTSIQNWRPRQPLAAAQAPEPTVADGVGLADYARSVMAGGAQLVQGVGWAAKMLGSEDIGGTIEGLGRDAVDYWNEGLSDAAKDALSREFVSKNEAGEWEWGDATLHTVGLFGAQSLLGTAAGAGAGAGITKVLQAFANPVGRSVLLQAARAGSEQALKKLSLVDKVIGAAGFGAGEGAVGGMTAGMNVYDRVMRMSPEDMVNNPRYQQVFNSTDETMPELERHQYAADTVAREASSLAGLQSGLTTALLGAPAGAYFGGLFGRAGLSKIAGGRLKEMAVGAAGEGAQEFAQGAAEQLITNKALQGAGAKVDTWDDVLNQALGGAVAGAPLGGAMGAAGGHSQPETGAHSSDSKQPKPPASGAPSTGSSASSSDRYLEPIREAANAAVAKGADQAEVLKVVKAVADGTEPVLTGAGKLRKMAMGAPAAVQPKDLLERPATTMPAQDRLASDLIEVSDRSEAEEIEAANAKVPRGTSVDKSAALPTGRQEASVYRGVTSDEFEAISQAGEIKTTGRYSHSSEGTSFADDADLARSTVTFGRDDPAKTGKPAYVLEVAKGDDIEVDKRDGFPKSKMNPDGTRAGIPAERITRAWRFNPDGTAEAIDPPKRPQPLYSRAPTAPRVDRDERLTGEDKAIEQRLAQRIEADPAGIEREYAKLDGTLGGKLLNTDLARELSPDYLKDRKRSAAVHEPASSMVKWLYERRLAEEPAPGDLPEVLFTAGGTGAGKTTGLAAAAELDPDINRAQIIYDTNMNGASSSIRKIEQALAAGKSARIVYTYRDPVDALVKGALPRAARQTKSYGSGRTVPLEAHAETHVGARQTMEAVIREYANDDRVQITVIDNSHGKGGARLVDVEDLPQLDYDSVREQLQQNLDAEYQAGRLDRPTYLAFGGQEEAGLTPESDRQRVRPRPESPAAPRLEVSPALASRGAEQRRGEPKLSPAAERALTRTTAQETGQVKAVREAIQPIMDGLAPLIGVQIHPSVSSLRRATGDWSITGDVRGAWIPGDSTVHLVADTIPKGEEQKIAVHEIFGHLAMERYAEGRAAIEAVQSLIGKGAKWVQPYVQDVTSRYGDLTDSELAKEVIAHMAERGDKSLVITRLIAGVKRFLRKLGIKVDYSEADIREVIARSARALRGEAQKLRELQPKLRALRPNATDGDILEALDEDIPPTVTAIDAYLAARAAGDTETVKALQAERDLSGTLSLSRGGDQTQTEAFRRWFGGSKVVDDNGRPLVVFHGTSGIRDDMRDQGSVPQFDVFDPKKRGAVTGSSDAKAGFWFTSSRDRAWMAGRDAASVEEGSEENEEIGYQYKSHVLSAYARIINPLVLADISDYSPSQVARIAKKAKADGHDGLIFTKGENPSELRMSGGVSGSDYLVFEPTQIKSATDNAGTFDPSKPSILYSRAAAADPAVQAILDRVMVKPPEALTMKDRARGLWQKVTDITGIELKQGLIDSFASIEQLEREFTGGALLDASQSAHKSALSTKNLPSVMAAVMLKGVPTFKDGVYQPVAGRKGVIEIFDPLTKHKDGNLLQQWEGYAAARRASRLIKETNLDGTPREQLFTPAEIATLTALDQKYPEFRQVFDEWQGFNKDMLDLAEAAGTLDPEARKLWERNDYVPFYRAMDAVSERTGPRNKRGLANQRADIKRLSGSDKQLGNVFENMMLNTAHLMDASFKNRAMQRIVGLGLGSALEPVPLQSEAVKISDDQLARALSAAGLIVGNVQTDPYGVTVVQKMTAAQKEHWSTLFRKVAPRGANIVSVMEAGKPQYFEVTDPLLLNSIAGMGYENFSDVFGLFRGSKKLLTHAITADPAFMLANFVRDTLSNWVISDTSVRPITDAIKGIKATLANDPDIVQLMMAGAGGGGFYDSAPAEIRKLIASRVPAGQQRLLMDSVVGPKNLWSVWRKVGAASENANRVATFRRVLANGGTVAEAAYQARDVLNFSMSGDFAAIRWLTQSVPFLNARIQGLYRLYRGARDNKRAFFIKGTMLAAATMALALKNDDDERYEELPEWDKDTYWHFWLGEEHYRIPKPFEVGALFSTIPERMFRTATGRDSFKILGQRMFRMFADTFAFNPTPQLVKPIIEQYANKSMFTGSPIVGMAEQNLQPEAQYTPWTSETMRELASAMPDFAPAWLRSPRRLEAAVRAYTGALGMYALATSDAAVRTALGYPEEPSRKIYDLPVVSRFWKDPDPRHTRYADQMYEMLDEANAVSATVNRMTRERRFEEAAELREANKGKLAVRVRLNRLGTNVRNLNNQIRLIQLDRNLDGDTKRTRIDALVERKNAVTREVARYSDVF